LNASDTFIWKELPELPAVPGEVKQPGLAGAFAGVINDGLIVAGGTNFPEGLPWVKLTDGSTPKKIYHREIYVYQKGRAWQISDVKLPKGYSYGVSIPTDEGLLCIGGEWREYDVDGVKNYISDKVILIKHLGEGKIEIDENSFPVLPEAVSAMAGARIGNHIYIAGGNNGDKETKIFWRLDITKKDK